MAVDTTGSKPYVFGTTRPSLDVLKGIYFWRLEMGCGVNGGSSAITITESIFPCASDDKLKVFLGGPS